jgi:hypothetical protein
MASVPRKNVTSGKMADRRPITCAFPWLWWYRYRNHYRPWFQEQYKYRMIVPASAMRRRKHGGMGDGKRF